MSELLCAVIVLTAFAVQLAVLFATANRFRSLRFAVPVLAAIAGAALFLSAVLPPGMARAFWWLALFLILLGLGLVLIGWGAAWLVYYLIKRT